MHRHRPGSWKRENGDGGNDHHITLLFISRVRVDLVGDMTDKENPKREETGAHEIAQTAAITGYYSPRATIDGPNQVFKVNPTKKLNLLHLTQAVVR